MVDKIGKRNTIKGEEEIQEAVMIYTALTNKAIKIAYKAHLGMTDGAGVPLVCHPLHVAEDMTDEESTCVALLHDVVEDSQITIEDLQKEFPKSVTEAVKLLTREKGTEYFDYISAIKKNPLALRVKLADLKHNSDHTRLAGCENIDREKMEKLKNRYKRAVEMLTE